MMKRTRRNQNKDLLNSSTKVSEKILPKNLESSFVGHFDCLMGKI